MPELKEMFQALGFADALTYINSGNVVFTGDGSSEADMRASIEEAITARFGLQVPVGVFPAHKIAEALDAAPAWWGDSDKATYDSMIFVLPPTQAVEVFEIIGPHRADLENVEACGDIIFWTANRAQWSKTRWAKLASSKANNLVTVRNANTARKLVALATNK